MENERGIKVCDICGRKFKMMEDLHYVARDNKQLGVAYITSNNKEVKLYDAFDCPLCGCQNIVQERKRKKEDIINKDDEVESI